MAEQFTVTHEHITLSKHLWVQYQDVEFGAPEVDPKRPYGTSDVVHYMAELLELDLPKDEDGRFIISDGEDARLTQLHRDMVIVLQIGLSTGTFTPGTYERVSHNTWLCVDEPGPLMTVDQFKDAVEGLVGDCLHDTLLKLMLVRPTFISMTPPQLFSEGLSCIASRLSKALAGDPHGLEVALFTDRVFAPVLGLQPPPVGVEGLARLDWVVPELSEERPLMYRNATAFLAALSTRYGDYKVEQCADEPYLWFLTGGGNKTAWLSFEGSGEWQAGLKGFPFEYLEQGDSGDYGRLLDFMNS